MIVLMNCMSAVSGGALSYMRNLLPMLHENFIKSDGLHSLRVLVHESQLQLFQGVPEDVCYIVKGKRPSGFGRLIWEHKNLPVIAGETNSDVHFVPYQVARRISGVRQVLMLRNMEPFNFRRYKYCLRLRMRNGMLAQGSKRSLYAADRVIAVSEYAENYLINDLKVSPTGVRQIYHGRDVTFSPNGDTDQDAALISGLGIAGDFILTCGSLLPYRRCEDIIRSFGNLEAAQRGDIRLVVAGSGNDRAYNRLLSETVSDSGVSTRIHMLGNVSKDIMQALYRRCLFCVIATEIEACPNIVIESLSSGCAVISADQPPLPEMFKGASLQYASRDNKALTECMGRCLFDERYRKDLSVRALKRGEDFSWERCARETYDALVNW